MAKSSSDNRIALVLNFVRGDVVGRQCLSVKICSCPKRDKEREEADNPLSEGWSIQGLEPSIKSKKRSSENKYNSAKRKLDNSQLKAASQMEQKKYDDIKSILLTQCEQIALLSENQNKLLDMMVRMEDLQTKTVETLFQLIRQFPISYTK